MYELSKTDNVQLKFVNGQVEAPPAMGVAAQYEGPYYRFFGKDVPHHTQLVGVAKALSRQVISPEDYARGWREKGMTDRGSSNAACDYLQQYIEQHDGDPFDGVLGFSEGASIAANLIFRQSVEKWTSPFQFAIFICGFPPFQMNGSSIMLADETAERINIPTAHIVGSKDPVSHASRALYNLCHQPSASIFEHGGAHTIPWDLATTQRIAKEIRSLVERSQPKPSV